MAIRKLARGLAWVVGVCVGLAAFAYVVAFAINWNDEAPSKDAVALTRLVEDRREVPDAANAWFVNLGMNAPEGVDPVAQATARKRYFERYGLDEHTRMPGRERDYRVPPPRAFAALEEACRKREPKCVELMHGAPAVLDQRLASERWLLERFEHMETLTAWEEIDPAALGADTPTLRPMQSGQQLVLLQAWKQARDGDGEAALAALERDFVFWRMVLRSADTLIVKTVANYALQRNLFIGNQILRELHATGRPAAPPTAWTQPMTREDLSMRRVFASEYKYAESMGLKIGESPNATSGNPVEAAFLRPFYKPQATANLYARDVVRVSDRLDVEVPKLPAAVDALEREAVDRDERFHVYNAFGHRLVRTSEGDQLIPYALRVADLEGVRRATLLAAQLRADKPAAPAIAVREASLKDPYTQAPFAWDAQAASIVFTGLADGDRKRHAIQL